MKLVKLSLVAALAVGSMSVLEAKPLEDAIRNVDVSGALRYRFDQATFNKGNFGAYGVSPNNVPHKVRAFVGTRIDAGDNFKIFGQLMYNNDGNGGWQKAGATDPDKNEFGLTTTKSAPVLKQAYLQYDLADAGLSVLFGKQELGTIWTADFTGMAAKVLFTPAQGLTIAAFGVDSFEGISGDGDASKLFETKVGGKTTKTYYDHNMYGAAVLANFAGLDAQVWGAHWDKIATLYAVNLKYTLGFGGGNNAGVKVTYLGNYIDGTMKQAEPTANLKNGNLVDGRLFANVSGLDARLGGIFYGDKKGTTINTLEDISGPDLYIGREMFYANKTALVESKGQSLFGYVGVGYTLPYDIRVGLQGVFGQNTDATTNTEIKDTRIEGVFELGYKVNKNLSFESWYSYLNSKVKGSDAEDKQTVRFQALYKF